MNLNFSNLIRGGIVLLACIIALLVGASLTTGAFLPLALAAGIAMIVVTAALPDWLAVLCIAFSLLSGRTGLGVGYWEILASALIARWLLIVPFKGGAFGPIHGKITFVCILGFTSVLLVHGVPAFIGMSESGRRPAVLAAAAIGITYLLLTQKLDLRKLSYLPWAGLAVGMISLSFDLINLAIPSALPILYMIYNDQNWEMLAEYRGAQITLLRLSGLREFGLGLGFLSLTYFAFERRFRLGRLALQTVMTGIAVVATIFSGYRSFVAQIFLGVILAAYARSRGTVIAVSICGTLLISGLIIYHHAIDPLPLPMQRALSWLPGDWDWRTKSYAEGGFEWRTSIRDYYFRSIFPDSWLLGRGLQFDERIGSMAWMISDPQYNIDYFVAMQLYHSGLVSSLDYVGVLGTAFLIAGCLRAIWNAIVILHRREKSEKWQFWIAVMFLTATPPFWYTGFFDRAFPFFVVAMCLLEIARIAPPDPFSDDERHALPSSEKDPGLTPPPP